MKHIKPNTPGQRGQTFVAYKGVVTTNKPEKKLVKGTKRGSGRNNQGRITTRHQGGGHKRLFRDIDFKFNKRDIPATIKTIEYDPFRSGFIALVSYADGEKRYILASKSMKVDDTFVVSETALIKVGNRLPLGKMPVGTFVYAVELKPGAGAVIARSAGNYAEVIAQDEGKTHLKMPSTEVRKIVSTCWATVGEVSNSDHRLENYGKAGKSRHKGIRPTVRGTAQNPVDHPHGGGEGRQGRGRRRAISVYGRPTGKGQKTRTPKKYSNVFIVARRKVGKKK
jgi:large subunit ribosomal protein L2